jgi:alanine dehydrogenase
MIIGIPKEVKESEYRVAVTPEGVHDLVAEGNRVLVQKGAGMDSGFSNREYGDAGAEISGDAEKVYKTSEMIVKVKEPSPAEVRLIKKDQIIFAFFHLSSNKGLTEDLLKTGSTCIAYETIERNGHFPLLAPMSEIAGRVAAIVGAYYLGINFGGKGLLISGLSGIPPGNVLILGAGVAARSAAQVASGLGAKVTLMSPFIEELREIEMNNYFGPHVSTLFMSKHNISAELPRTDILISAVYVRGARTPTLVTRDMVKMMKKGTVIVAIDIDQGSSIETARPTSHQDPIYSEEGVIHYCVANMPGVFSRTSTVALTNLTLPYIKRIAARGIKVLKEDPEIKTGLNIYKGRISYKKVAEDHNLESLYREFK